MSPPPEASSSNEWIFSQTPLIFKTYLLYCAVQKSNRRFPKPTRYSLGEQLQIALLRVIDKTCQGLYARQPLKEPYVLEVAGAVQIAQLFIRMIFEENLISEQQFFTWSNQAQELHKMAIGWLKSVRSPDR